MLHPDLGLCFSSQEVDRPHRRAAYCHMGRHRCVPWIILEALRISQTLMTLMLNLMLNGTPGADQS